MNKKLFFATVAVFLFSEIGFGQMQIRSKSPSWRANTAVILFSGVGGGILGLSTLSFYGDPKEHTNNVTTGALLGLALGAAYVVYENTPKLQRPTKSNDYYGLFESEQNKRPTYASVPSLQFEFTY